VNPDVFRAVLILQEALLVAAWSWSLVRGVRNARSSSGALKLLWKGSSCLSAALIVIFLALVQGHVDLWGEPIGLWRAVRLAFTELSVLLAGVAWIYFRQVDFTRPQGGAARVRQVRDAEKH
jgi:hypothetical protein